MAYRFLIVDDSATTRAVIKRTIGLCGLDVEKIAESGNGRDALAILSVSHFDMVFLDLNMPEMSGADLTRKMRENAKLATTPVVIVSSESMESKIQYLKDLGARGYIKKPFTPEQIRDVINNTLGVSNAA